MNILAEDNIGSEGQSYFLERKYALSVCSPVLQFGSGVDNGYSIWRMKSQVQPLLVAPFMATIAQLGERIKYPLSPVPCHQYNISDGEGSQLLPAKKKHAGYRLFLGNKIREV